MKSFVNKQCLVLSSFSRGLLFILKREREVDLSFDNFFIQKKKPWVPEVLPRSPVFHITLSLSEFSECGKLVDKASELLRRKTPKHFSDPKAFFFNQFCFYRLALEISADKPSRLVSSG